MTIRTILVDDEALALEGLELRLQQFEQIDIVAKCGNGFEALEKVKALAPDLIFLDMDMPGISGIEVVEALPQDHDIAIIFVTAHKEYAIQAFDVQAVDYLLKPVSLGRLKKAIDKVSVTSTDIESDSRVKARLLNALESLSGRSPSEIEQWLKGDGAFPRKYPDKLIIKSHEHEKTLLPVAEIKWIDAAGDYMCINTNNGTHVLRSTMKKLSEQLDPNIFQRIHKSTIVNISYVEKVITLKNAESNLILKDGTELKSTRNYKINLLAK